MTQYTSENVPAPKKGTMGVNEAKIKNEGKKLNPKDRPEPTREQLKEINSKFQKKNWIRRKTRKLQQKLWNSL